MAMKKTIERMSIPYKHRRHRSQKGKNPKNFSDKGIKKFLLGKIKKQEQARGL